MSSIFEDRPNPSMRHVEFQVEVIGPDNMLWDSTSYNSLTDAFNFALNVLGGQAEEDVEDIKNGHTVDDRWFRAANEFNKEAKLDDNDYDELPYEWEFEGIKVRIT